MIIKTAADMIGEARKHINCVNVEQAKELFDSNENAIIIDVREADNAKSSKLDDSVNISRGLLEMKVGGVCSNVETVILTHCGGGGRACLAARTLVEMGYQNVYAITASYDSIKVHFDQA